MLAARKLEVIRSPGNTKGGLLRIRRIDGRSFVDDRNNVVAGHSLALSHLSGCVHGPPAIGLQGRVCQFWALVCLTLPTTGGTTFILYTLAFWESQTATHQLCHSTRDIKHGRVCSFDKKRLQLLFRPSLTPTTDRNLQEHAPRSLSLLADVSSAESVLVGTVLLSTPCVRSQ